MGGDPISCPAGVSSFGFGGALAHLVVDAEGASESWGLRAHHQGPLFGQLRPFPWRADSDEEAHLNALCDRVAEHFEAAVAKCVQRHLLPGVAPPARGDPLTPIQLLCAVFCWWCKVH
jgi:hypothetical protein